MAIDADLSAGLIDAPEAQRRRHELEEESSFFGAMDGASKFVRGDAIAGLIITAVNILGGIIIGVTRHGMTLSQSADVFVKLAVGDGLVTQIPALIVSLAAGLLVSKGGTRGTAEQAILGQLGHYPRALFVASFLMVILALVPGLPLLPFALLGGLMAFVGYTIPKRIAERAAAAEEIRAMEAEEAARESQDTIKESLRTAEIELGLGKQLAAEMLTSHSELAHRVGKMRKKFAQQYGFVVPEIKLSDSLTLPPKQYEFRIHGTVAATGEMRPGSMLVVVGDGRLPDLPGEEVREPAFGVKAMWVSESYANEVRREGMQPVDRLSVLLTHLSETIRKNLGQLLSYKDMRALLDRLGPEYKKLLDEICPAHMSLSSLQAVLRLLLAERVSIRNLHLILEVVAEIAPHVRRAEQIAEHVRMRMAQQICGDLTQGGVLNMLRLGNRWDLAFHESLRRDAKGEVVEFDIDPRLIEEFAAEATTAIRTRMDQGQSFVLVTSPDARPYVRMIVERIFPALPVLSHVEIARGLEVNLLGTIS
jgi:flagellar biosynthesis protein FlhA